MALTYLQQATDTTDLTTYTFAAQNLGTASSNRYIAVVVYGRKSGAATTISGVTVAGISATIVVQVNNTNVNTNVVGIAIAAVPTGTSGDVVVVFADAMARGGIDLYSLTEISSTVFSTGSDINTAPTINLSTIIGGYIIAATKIDIPNPPGGAASITWTGVTENSDTQVESFSVMSAGSIVATSNTTTITATPTNTPSASVGVFACWRIGRNITGISSISRITSITF